MQEAEQFHYTNLEGWTGLGDKLAEIPQDANLHMIVWSLPHEKDVQGAD